MLVTSLSYMEELVCNRNDLEWDGWDVLRFTKAPSAYSSPDGVMRDGVWYRCKRYTLTEKGWTIPNSLAKVDA